jgi:hypothetical protein
MKLGEDESLLNWSSLYAGPKIISRPLYFILDNRKLEVRNIIDRWYGVEDDYFKVLAEDGKVYLLKWTRLFDQWFVVRIMEKLGKH